MTPDEAFARWLGPSGYGYFDVSGDGHPTFTLDPMRRTSDYNEGGMQLPSHIASAATSGTQDPGDLVRQWFDKLNAPDSSGRQPWGSALIPFNDSGSAWDPTRGPVNINGQERIQTGTDLAGILSPELQNTLRQRGVDPASLISYDPTYGYTAPADTLRSLYPDRQAEALSGEDFFDSGTNLVGLMAAVAGGVNFLNGGFGGLGLSDLPDSYWSMLADAGGASDALPAAAGSMEGPFSSLYGEALAGPLGVAPYAGDAAYEASGLSDLSSRNALTALNGTRGSMSFLSDLFSPQSLLSSGLNLVGNIGGSLINANAAKKAAGTLQDAAGSSNALLASIYSQNRADLEPWRQSGINALSRLSQLTTPGSQVSQMELDPGYQFRLNEGTKALERSAAAKGLLQSGGTLKGITRYGQDYASGEYGNIVNRLLAQSGLGQTATNTGVQASQNYGNNAANNLLSAGNARASGYVGSSNAISGGVNSFLNNFNQQNVLNQLLGAR